MFYKAPQPCFILQHYCVVDNVVIPIIRAGAGLASCCALGWAACAGDGPAAARGLLCTFDLPPITKYISCGNCHHLYNIKHPNREGNKLVKPSKENTYSRPT